MKHKRNLLKILQFLIVISISFGLAAEVKRFTKTQVLSDFEILYQSVIASHYQNMFSYGRIKALRISVHFLISVMNGIK